MRLFVYKLKHPKKLLNQVCIERSKPIYTEGAGPEMEIDGAPRVPLSIVRRLD